jgi:flagellar hook assembly protein FlgD
VKLDQPDVSLILLKPLQVAAGGVPHGLFNNDGGKQFQNTTSDMNYIAIRDWIHDAITSTVGARITRTETYPNPFRFETDIVYILSATATGVKVTVYSQDGHTLRTFTGPGLVGANRVHWDGRDGDGDPLPTGLYFYNVKATFDNGTATKAGKCVLTP